MRARVAPRTPCFIASCLVRLRSGPAASGLAASGLAASGLAASGLAASGLAAYASVRPTSRHVPPAGPLARRTRGSAPGAPVQLRAAAVRARLAVAPAVRAPRWSAQWRAPSRTLAWPCTHPRCSGGCCAGGWTDFVASSGPVLPRPVRHPRRHAAPAARARHPAASRFASPSNMTRPSLISRLAFNRGLGAS